jgi:hypothetical protein
MPVSRTATTLDGWGNALGVKGGCLAALGRETPCAENDITIDIWAGGVLVENSARDSK